MPPGGSNPNSIISEKITSIRHSVLIAEITPDKYYPQERKSYFQSYLPIIDLLEKKLKASNNENIYVLIEMLNEFQAIIENEINEYNNKCDRKSFFRSPPNDRFRLTKSSKFKSIKDPTELALFELVTLSDSLELYKFLYFKDDDINFWIYSSAYCSLLHHLASHDAHTIFKFIANLYSNDREKLLDLFSTSIRAIGTYERTYERETGCTVLHVASYNSSEKVLRFILEFLTDEELSEFLLSTQTNNILKKYECESLCRCSGRYEGEHTCKTSGLLFNTLLSQQPLSIELIVKRLIESSNSDLIDIYLTEKNSFKKSYPDGYIKLITNLKVIHESIFQDLQEIPKDNSLYPKAQFIIGETYFLQHQDPKKGLIESIPYFKEAYDYTNYDLNEENVEIIWGLKRSQVEQEVASWKENANTGKVLLLLDPSCGNRGCLCFYKKHHNGQMIYFGDLCYNTGESKAKFPLEIGEILSATLNNFNEKNNWQEYDTYYYEDYRLEYKQEYCTQLENSSILEDLKPSIISLLSEHLLYEGIEGSKALLSHALQDYWHEESFEFNETQVSIINKLHDDFIVKEDFIKTLEQKIYFYQNNHPNNTRTSIKILEELKDKVIQTQSIQAFSELKNKYKFIETAGSEYYCSYSILRYNLESYFPDQSRNFIRELDSLAIKLGNNGDYKALNRCAESVYKMLKNTKKQTVADCIKEAKQAPGNLHRISGAMLALASLFAPIVGLPLFVIGVRSIFKQREGISKAMYTTAKNLAKQPKETNPTETTRLIH